MKIALGTAQFGMNYGIANTSGIQAESEIFKILNLSSINGIDTLDTAISYGNSENVIGKYNLDNFKLITKLPKLDPSVNNPESWIIDSLNGSLNRLNQSKIYALLLHAPYDLKGPYGKCIIKTLNEFKSKKIIQKLGISIYSPSELNDLLPLIDLDLVQVPYNIFDRRIEKSGWLKVLNDRSIEVHGRSAFLQGLLTMEFNEIPDFFARYKKIFKAWSDWTTSNNLSLIEASLLFSISSNQIQKTVIGIDNIDQLTEIIEYSKNTKTYDFPDFSIDDEALLNPSNWKIA